MKKAEKRMSWKEVFQMNIRGLKLFYERYPQMVISRFISVIWNALTPYVGIFLSALVVDELVGNRDGVILRVELSRSEDEIEADISYIPCMSADSACGIMVHPVSNCFNDASKRAYDRIKDAMGKEVHPFKYRPKIMISGSVILKRIFSVGDFADIDKTPLLLSQLTACSGEGMDAGELTGTLKLDVEKSFPEYLKK